MKYLSFSRFDGKSVTDEKDLSEIINDGPKSKKFRDLIVWITDEIRVLANIEEKVILHSFLHFCKFKSSINVMLGQQ